MENMDNVAKVDTIESINLELTTGLSKLCLDLKEDLDKSSELHAAAFRALSNMLNVQSSVFDTSDLESVEYATAKLLVSQIKRSIKEVNAKFENDSERSLREYKAQQERLYTTARGKRYDLCND